MDSGQVILAIDCGTTSCRTLAFDHDGQILATEQLALKQYFPEDGWVEHDAVEIWLNTLKTIRATIQTCKDINQLPVAIGITNQRETLVVWDRKTGAPIHKALVWQDRRTAEFCKKLTQEGKGERVQNATGLLLDPYFSASKIAWILDNVPGARARADKGELVCGTVDSYVIWNLTGGKSHLTDETNASRTSLYNIHDGKWDEEMLEIFNVPKSLLPDVLPSVADFGTAAADIIGMSLPICGVAGDQQAASFGQGCFEAGMSKATYGTGCFALVNTGNTPVKSSHKLLTTIACRSGGDVQYAIEGSIFIAGAVVQWMKERMELVEASGETEELAAALESNKGVYLVPAFTGLGAPYWDSEARGAIFGLRRETGKRTIVRAGLESVAYQTRDLVSALNADGYELKSLRVDGGMSQNNWLMQFLSDVLNIPVERSSTIESTALGVAMLAGLYIGFWKDEQDLKKCLGTTKAFLPKMDDEIRQQQLAGWDIAVKSVRYHAELSRG
ncbi:glycerol kinase GlpK [Hirschia baltica]|uniref:Glycerol kinase n=1 Tax=Hirschia baltica (strain ATCC 49814 / DSM 5838 / IFAM 1418) TaxID=582402 RepID=C6XQW2_HIRBI|nr:glycerol kinase GlpK [Hirschia baltica]ACT60493.1 glycerol kinase [Hirschia baltica ATCC 49814]